MFILRQTLRQMPRMFTSNYFNKKAIENGYSAELIKHKGLSSFLHKHATISMKGGKTWYKNDPQSQHNDVTKSGLKPLPDNSNLERSHQYKFDSIDEVILFLKEKGYKIMKPKTDWEEC